MNRTKIEWCDYTWNPVVGCKRGCPYCYAKKVNDRFNKTSFDVLQYHPERLTEPCSIKKPSRIFIGSMSDIYYWDKGFMNWVFNIIRKCPQHTFLFLTKSSEIYSEYCFPSNCWLGVTENAGYLRGMSNENNTTFVSIEPLIEQVKLGFTVRNLMDWIIIGGLTPQPVHKKEWVDYIIQEARASDIPIFLKDNLHYPEVIKEFPQGTK